jgi:O-antigen/teichoic acid export membrane protein
MSAKKIIPPPQPLDPQQLKRKTVSGAISFFVRTLILNGIGLAANLILGGLLAVTDFGIYGVVIQIIGVLTFFSDIGLASALIQRPSEPSDRDYQTIFWTQMSLAVFIVAICFALVQSGFFAHQLGAEGPAILYALAFSFILSAFKTIPSIKLTRALDFSKFVLPQIIEQLVFNGLLIILVLQGFGLQSYTLAIWARSLIGTALMLYLVPFFPRFTFSLRSFKRTIKYGCKFQANDLLARLKDQLFYLFVAKQMSLSDFGLVSFAKNWSMYPYNLTVQNVMSITFPTFSRLQAHSTYLARAIEKSIYFITLFIFPLLTGMCLFFYPLTQVIERYGKWEDALLSFVLFTLAIAPAAISSPLTNVLNAIGKINQTLYLMIIWTLLTWGLTLPLLHFYGFNAVAIASFIISLTSFAPVYLVKKSVPFKLLPQIWVPSLACLAMALVILPLMQFWVKDLPHTLLGGVIAIIVYVLVVLACGWRQLWAEIRSLR